MSVGTKVGLCREPMTLKLGKKKKESVKYEGKAVVECNLFLQP